MMLSNNDHFPLGSVAADRCGAQLRCNWRTRHMSMRYPQARCAGASVCWFRNRYAQAWCPARQGFAAGTPVASVPLPLSIAAMVVPA